MKAENMVKEQARKTLKNGNWCSAVVTFFVLLSVLCFSIIISELIYIFQPDENIVFSNMFIMILFLVFEILFVAAMVFLSPVYTGALRYYEMLANNKEADISQVFYYLTKDRYFPALSFNIALIGRYIAYGIISFIPALICGIAAGILSNIYPGSIAAAVMIILSVFILITCLVLFYAVTRKYFAASYLFVDDDLNICGRDCIRASKILMKNNTAKPVKLFVSFIPWFLLCFFVFPLIYVFPYYNQAKSFSSRWIYEINCGKIKDKVIFQREKVNAEIHNFQENYDNIQYEASTD